MRTLSRTNRSAIAEWWWTVDRLSLAAAGVLVFVGILLAFAAGPAAADRIGISNAFHFVYKQLIFLGPAIGLAFAVSLASPLYVRRMAFCIFFVALALMVFAMFFAPEVKGAHRWVYFAGVSLQPSEFAKPAFIVTAAWMFAEQRRDRKFPGTFAALGLYIVFAALLALQPDFGQTVLVTAAWAGLLFLAGLSWHWIGALCGLAAGGAYLAYSTVDHVASRVNRFLDPASGDTYQIDTALNAISRGGLLGQGPGEGRVKELLPDAHTDFIFAVAGEEFGVLFCILIVCAFALIVLRGYGRAFRETSPFVQLASCGLASLIGLQALINIAVNLRLAPTKGMTLPLVSYGGSSLLATGLAIGMLLALTRERPGGWREKDFI